MMTLGHPINQKCRQTGCNWSLRDLPGFRWCRANQISSPNSAAHSCWVLSCVKNTSVHVDRTHPNPESVARLDSHYLPTDHGHSTRYTPPLAACSRASDTQNTKKCFASSSNSDFFTVFPLSWSVLVGAVHGGERISDVSVASVSVRCTSACPKAVPS